MARVCSRVCLRRYGAAQGVARAVGEGAFAAVHAPPQRRRVSRFATVAGGCAAVVLVVVALAAVQEPHGELALGEAAAASSFQQDSEAAIKIKAAKDEYDAARGQVHTLKEGLAGLERRLKDQLGVMDAARDDLVKRIKKVEKLPAPPEEEEEDDDSAEASVVRGGTELASTPLKRLEALETLDPSTKQSKVKSIAKRLMFPKDTDPNDPLTSIEKSVLKKGWSGHGRSSATPSAWKCRTHPNTPGCEKASTGRSHGKSGSSTPSAWMCRTHPNTPGCQKASTGRTYGKRAHKSHSNHR